MLEEDSGDQETIKMGITFYQHILKESDAQLELGNLPREEAEASLSELLALRAKD